MRGYSINNGVSEAHTGRRLAFLAKATLFIIWFLIGAYIGLWFAIRTMPLPITTVNYVTRP